MAEAAIKAAAIVLGVLLVITLFTLRYTGCEGDYCPSYQHAIQKWEKVNEALF